MASYHRIMAKLDKFVPSRLLPLWQHPAGPKTIFFWAPAVKWSLVIAGIGDINRPASSVSFPQSLALAFTGSVWARYSLVIIPKNYSLFTVNVFVFSTAAYQLFRGVKYRLSESKLEEEKVV
ncbi:unnamed protein product [Orchesella dallaii]|uniref:Mitochondrial pyruvate carrier n=1 Tax=Orchesella dallaii TaxID=48710 RepID=A0ABP1QRQ3_9HEXA